MSETHSPKSKFSLDYLIRTIPELPQGLAIVILICNICFPSSGTFYMACIGDKVRKTQFYVAVLQLVTTPLIIGYVWSIYWGVKSLKKSYSASENHTQY